MSTTIPADAYSDVKQQSSTTHLDRFEFKILSGSLEVDRNSSVGLSCTSFFLTHHFDITGCDDDDDAQHGLLMPRTRAQ